MNEPQAAPEAEAPDLPAEGPPAPTTLLDPPVLEFDAARLALDTLPGLGRRAGPPITLRLAPGSLTLIDPQGAGRTVALGDACAGLLPPETGAVRFLGQDWARLGPAQAARLRARIGRCFSGGFWLPHLSVHHNLTLAARHQAPDSAQRVTEQANRLAIAFGLPGVPTTLPAETDPQDLARAAMIGAFLGRPDLLVLEEPRRFLPAEVTTPLVHAIRAARDRGAAVLWLTTGGALGEALLPATQRFRLASGRLIPTRAAETVPA
jgi:phospholipid/cholesterol/gamma-HCH transport system ATP-binding protein